MVEGLFPKGLHTFVLFLRRTGCQKSVGVTPSPSLFDCSGDSVIYVQSLNWLLKFTAGKDMSGEIDREKV